MPLVKKMVKDPETDKDIEIFVPKCRFCGKEYEWYDCEHFKELNIIRERHINICSECHDKKIPKTIILDRLFKKF